LRVAVYFVGSSSSFSEAPVRSLASIGPTNYCPVLVGAIGGARRGVRRAGSPADSKVPTSAVARLLYPPHGDCP
jgi:hypothetical protein